MKKKLITTLVLIGVFITACFAIEGVYTYNKSGTMVEPGQIHSLQDNWVTLGTIFTTATTTPDPNHRTASTFTSDANNATKEIPSKWNQIRLRCLSQNDGDDSVFDIFLMNGTDDHYTRIATLSWVNGLQTSSVSGYEFADTLVVTNHTNCWHTTGSTVNPGGNYIAEWSVDVLGSKMIGVSPTTIDSNSIFQITGF